MPAIVTLGLADGQSPTPVNRNFAPVTTTGTVAKFADRAAPIISGWGSLTIEHVTPKTATGAHRVKMGLNIPETAVINGVTQVVRNSSASIVLNFSPDSTDQERKNLRSLAQNLLASATVRAAIDNLEPFY